MTQPLGAGAPLPVAGVTGGPGLPQGVASVDGGTGNVVISPPSNAIQFRKGGVPQSLQIYESFISDTDFMRLSLNATIGGPFLITTEFAGSGVARDLQISAANKLQLISRGATTLEFWTSNSLRWQIGAGGGLLPFTDATFPLGNTTTSRISQVGTVTLSLATQSPFGFMFGGTGVPSVGIGANGDFFFRVDGAALTTIYQKRAGVWTGIV